MLHFVSVCGDSYQNTDASEELKALAEQLDAQLWGLLPGFHRLVFEGGQVLLTLCLGNIQTQLKQHSFQADSVFIDNVASFGLTRFTPSKPLQNCAGAAPLLLQLAHIQLCNQHSGSAGLR